jgi:hypothetical protein
LTARERFLRFTRSKASSLTEADCRKARDAVFDPRNDTSTMVELFNAGPRARRIAFDMADDDLRQFERHRIEKDSTNV